MPQPLPVEKLLRLKRHEQPPDGYFEDFLREFQRRQRTELMRISPWELWRDRFSAALSGSPWQTRTLGWAGAACAAAVAVWIVANPADREATVADASPSRENSASVRTVSAVPVESISRNRGAADGSQLVSQQSSSEPAANGLRRRPEDSTAVGGSVPFATPVAKPEGSANSHSDDRSLIILVR